MDTEAKIKDAQVKIMDAPVIIMDARAEIVHTTKILKEILFQNDC